MAKADFTRHRATRTEFDDVDVVAEAGEEALRIGDREIFPLPVGGLVEKEDLGPEFRDYLRRLKL